jgi:hypothetical protein
VLVGVDHREGEFADRSQRMSALLDAYAARQGEQPKARHVCPVCVEALPIDGAAFSLGANRRRSFVVSTAGRLAQHLADLQFMMGEGPKIDALEAGCPVVVPDLAAACTASRWPLFAPAAANLGIRALCALPLAWDDVRAGVLQLYRTSPGCPTVDELADAVTLAYLGLELALAAAQPDRADDQQWIIDHDLGGRATVHQATGVVAAQLGISADDALARLQLYAYCCEQSVTEVARAVMTGRLRLPHHAGNRS